MSKLNKYGYEIKDNQNELKTELKRAQEKYGERIPYLNEISVASVKSLLHDDYFQYFVNGEEDDIEQSHVYADKKGSDWYGYLTGIVLHWYTDEDFTSGVFEENSLYSLKLLKALNEFMLEYSDRDWDFEASNKRIELLKSWFGKNV